MHFKLGKYERILLFILLHLPSVLVSFYNLKTRSKCGEFYLKMAKNITKVFQIKTKRSKNVTKWFQKCCTTFQNVTNVTICDNVTMLQSPVLFQNVAKLLQQKCCKSVKSVKSVTLPDVAN